MDQDRFEAIETKLAFQEKMIKDLNDVIFDQQKELDSLKFTCDKLTKQIKILSEAVMHSMGPDIGPAGEKPPHY